MKLPFEWLKSIADCCSVEAAICKMEKQETAATRVENCGAHCWLAHNEWIKWEFMGAQRVGPGQKRWSGNLFWFAAWSCSRKQYCRVPWRALRARKPSVLTQYSAEPPAVGAGMIHRGSHEQSAREMLPPENLSISLSIHQHTEFS